jgi:hypothetical protein
MAAKRGGPQRSRPGVLFVSQTRCAEFDAALIVVMVVMMVVVMMMVVTMPMRHHHDHRPTPMMVMVMMMVMGELRELDVVLCLRSRSSVVDGLQQRLRIRDRLEQIGERIRL